MRFADDFVVGFEYREEAERFLEELGERFARFGLELHPDKTRRIPFGRRAQADWQDGRGPKPDTFHFLGLTHTTGKTRHGKFIVLRQTMRKRVQAKLRAVKEELRRRMHQTIPEQGASLRSVVRGHVRYFGVALNGWAIVAFRKSVGRLWRGSGVARFGATAKSIASRRSDSGATWIAGLRPRVSATRIPGLASTSSPKVGARCRNAARRDLCRGL